MHTFKLVITKGPGHMDLSLSPITRAKNHKKVTSVPRVVLTYTVLSHHPTLLKSPSPALISPECPQMCLGTPRRPLQVAVDLTCSIPLLVSHYQRLWQYVPHWFIIHRMPCFTLCLVHLYLFSCNNPMNCIWQNLCPWTPLILTIWYFICPFIPFKLSLVVTKHSGYLK